MNKSMKLEEERIHWRRRVMAAGRVAWLLEQARRVKFKESALGPVLEPK